MILGCQYAGSRTIVSIADVYERQVRGRDEPVADDTVREGLCPTYSVDLPNSATQGASGIARDK